MSDRKATRPTHHESTSAGDRDRTGRPRVVPCTRPRNATRLPRDPRDRSRYVRRPVESPRPGIRRSPQPPSAIRPRRHVALGPGQRVHGQRTRNANADPAAPEASPARRSRSTDSRARTPMRCCVWRDLDGVEFTHRLTPDQPTYVVPASPRLAEVAWAYFVLGVEHILLGVDHLLFVLALLLIVRDWRVLVGTITAFTLAHSITLAAATLGWVDVPGPPRGSDHRPEHRVCGLGNHPRSARATGAHRQMAVDRLVYVRSAARFRLCAGRCTTWACRRSPFRWLC